MGDKLAEIKYLADHWSKFSLSARSIMGTDAADTAEECSDWLVKILPIVEQAVGIATYINTGGGAINHHCNFCGAMIHVGDEHRSDCMVVPLLEAVKKLSV